MKNKSCSNKKELPFNVGVNYDEVPKTGDPSFRFGYSHALSQATLHDSQGLEAPQPVYLQVAKAGLFMQQFLSQYPPDHNLTADQVRLMSQAIWDSHGVRLLLVDIFYDPSCKSYLRTLVPDDSFHNRPILNCAARMCYSLMDPFRFSGEFAIYGQHVADLIVFSTKLGIHGAQTYSLKITPSTPPVSDSFQLSSSQLSALNKLSRAIRIARGFKSIAGIKPRANIFLVGLSGAGKGFVIREAAAVESLPVFSLTLPSWIVTGARCEPTISLLTSWLQANPEGGLINIDEIEKIPVGKEEGNQSWFTAVRTEILKLLDFDIQGFDSYFNPTTKQALLRSVFVASGNFQQLYMDQISREAKFQSQVDGDDWLLAKEIGNLLPVSIQDVRDGKYLPEELINRFSPELVEVRPPTLEELAHHLASVDGKTGVHRSDHEIMEHAREIFLSGRGFRGLETYVFQLLEKADNQYRENLLP